MEREFWLAMLSRKVIGGRKKSSKKPGVTSRICFSCDHEYVGGIYCPACNKPDGEALEWRKRGEE